MNSWVAFKGHALFPWLAVMVLGSCCLSAGKGEETSTASGRQSTFVDLTALSILPDAKEGEGKVAPDKEKDAWLWVNQVPSWLNPKDDRVGGKICRTWLLMVHGSLSWNYALNGEYCSLVADLGQYDGTKAHLQIFGDAKQLYDSGYLPQVNHPITALLICAASRP